MAEHFKKEKGEDFQPHKVVVVVSYGKRSWHHGKKTLAEMFCN